MPSRAWRVRVVKKSYAEKIVVVPLSLNLPGLVCHSCDVADHLNFSLVFGDRSRAWWSVTVVFVVQKSIDDLMGSTSDVSNHQVHCT